MLSSKKARRFSIKSSTDNTRFGTAICRLGLFLPIRYLLYSEILVIFVQFRQIEQTDNNGGQGCQRSCPAHGQQTIPSNFAEQIGCGNPEKEGCRHAVDKADQGPPIAAEIGVCVEHKADKHTVDGTGTHILSRRDNNR